VSRKKQVRALRSPTSKSDFARGLTLGGNIWSREGSDKTSSDQERGRGIGKGGKDCSGVPARPNARPSNRRRRGGNRRGSAVEGGGILTEEEEVGPRGRKSTEREGNSLFCSTRKGEQKTKLGSVQRGQGGCEG